MHFSHPWLYGLLTLATILLLADSSGSSSSGIGVDWGSDDSTDDDYWDDYLAERRAQDWSKHH